MLELLAIKKILIFLFPFVKELFVSKDKNKYDTVQKPGPNSTFFKMTGMSLVVLSIVMNYYLITKVFKLGRENIALQKELKDKPNKPIVYPKTPDPVKSEPVKIAPEAVPPYEKPKPKDKLRDRKPIEKRPEDPPIVDKEKIIDDLEELNIIR